MPPLLIQVCHNLLTLAILFGLVPNCFLYHIAGTAVYEVDISAVINSCATLGFEEEDIIVDIILSGPAMIPHAMAKYFRTLQNIGRAMELQTHYQRLNGVIRAKQAHQNVTLRFIAGPDDELPSKTNPLDYTPEEVD